MLYITPLSGSLKSVYVFNSRGPSAFKGSASACGPWGPTLDRRALSFRLLT